MKGLICVNALNLLIFPFFSLVEMESHPRKVHFSSCFRIFFLFFQQICHHHHYCKQAE